jgi:hypothetical protein
MAGYVHWDDYDNEAAMAAYLARFANTSIKAVFSPILPAVPAYIANLETFMEVRRGDRNLREGFRSRIFQPA